MSSFIKRFLLAMLASKLSRHARRRGHGSPVDSLLREVDHRLNRRRRGGNYGHYGSGHHGYHGHYRRKRW
ncbi:MULTISPECIES: hypothetical protein [unclassified Micromonospora]|uniref:hypothetical protein n=1 Tax=unclassified Micromonospora TaxID=2617518 RepID=UPI003A8BE9E5